MTRYEPYVPPDEAEPQYGYTAPLTEVTLGALLQILKSARAAGAPRDSKVELVEDYQAGVTHVRVIEP